MLIRFYSENKSLNSTFKYSLIMFILRIFKKTRPKQALPFVQLIVCVFLTSFSIFVWKISGCVGFADCYLCEPYSPEYFFKNSNIISHPENDFQRLMDLNNFTFLLNNFACNNSDLILVVLVHSRPHNFEKRSAIRNTWGTVVGGKFKLLFMLGTTNSTEVQNKLYAENESNKDIVQGNFIDSYRNLTYKHVMVLKWHKYFCSNVKYLLKTDDDVFINTPSFLKYVENSIPETGLLMCLPVFGGRAQRTWRSKWRVTWTEYKYRQYPPYCQGFAILYSLDVVLNLYKKAQMANEYFWIDDVFITGLLAVSANYTPTTFGQHILEPKDLHKFMNNDSNKKFPFLLGPYNIKVKEIKQLWELYGGTIINKVDS